MKRYIIYAMKIAKRQTAKQTDYSTLKHNMKKIQIYYI